MEDLVTPILITEFCPKIPASIDPAPITRLTPHFHDITISNVHARNSKEAVVVVGLPESPILGLRLLDISIEAAKGATFQYVQLGTHNFTVQASAGDSVTTGEGVANLAK